MIVTAGTVAIINQLKYRTDEMFTFLAALDSCRFCSSRVELKTRKRTFCNVLCSDGKDILIFIKFASDLSRGNNK